MNMARWQPPDNVGENERVGRRLFAEPKLSGEIDQRKFSGLLLTHFEETRGVEYSLDRLGQSGIDKGVVSYLLPRAASAGTKFRKEKSFDGWAVVPARELSKSKKPPELPITPSPVRGADSMGNDYHAHVVRPLTHDHYQMALHLRYLFEAYGTVHSVDKSDGKESSLGWVAFFLVTLNTISARIWRALGGA